MTALLQWENCPEHIDIGDGKHRTRLLKQNNRFAIKGSKPPRTIGEVEMHLPGDDINIIRGTPSSDAASNYALLPVYAETENSPPTVVTQRIFARLDQDTLFETARESVEALGFRIDDIPSHAPHSAWLEPESGGVGDSLSKLASLRALPRVVNAEPQVLRPRERKPGK